MKIQKKKTDTFLSKSAANNLDSKNLSVPPELNLSNQSIQMQPAEEEEEEMQMKTEPFQLQPLEEEEEEMQMKSEPFQMQPAEEEEEEMQMKTEPFQLQPLEEEEEEMQMKKAKNLSQRTLNQSSNKTSLPETIQTKMESSFGTDFSDVNIHSNSQKAKGLGAQAFAQGNEVHFAPGKYDPKSQSGQELLGHELTHVVQQRDGRVNPTTQKKGVNVNADTSLENEADIMGKKAARGEKINLPKSESKTINSQQNPVQGFGFGDIVSAASNFIGGPTGNDSTTPQSTSNTTTGLGSAGPQSTDPSTCDPATQQAIDTFLAQGQYGPQSIVPQSKTPGGGTYGFGGFQGTYQPGASLLDIEVRGKTRFVNGLSDNGGTVNAGHEDLERIARLLNVLGEQALIDTVVPYFTWDDAAKQETTNAFKQRIYEMYGIWENPNLFMYIDEPCWEHITARPSFYVDVTDEGVASYDTSDVTGSEHLQVTMMKSPTNDEMSTVQTAIDEAAERIGTVRGICYDTEVDQEVRAYVDGNRENPDDSSDNNPYNTEMVLSSNDVLSHAGLHRDQSNLVFNIWFDHDSDSIEEADLDDLDTFLDDHKEGDSNNENSKISIEGHTSTVGSDEYNRDLAQRRINSVMTHLRANSFPNIDTRITEEVKGEDEAGNFPDVEQNHDYFRKVSVVIGSGEVQNTIAHEFGHVFGLDDEYVEGSRSVGRNVDHNQMSRRAGGGRAQAENSDNIMSEGNEVRAQHYSTFVFALNQLTNKRWKVSG